MNEQSKQCKPGGFIPVYPIDSHMNPPQTCHTSIKFSPLQQEELTRLLAALNGALSAFFYDPNRTTATSLQEVYQSFLTLFQGMQQSPEVTFLSDTTKKIITFLQETTLPIENIAQLSQLFLQTLAHLLFCSNLSTEKVESLFQSIVTGMTNSMAKGVPPSIPVSPSQSQQLESLLEAFNKSLQTFLKSPNPNTSGGLKSTLQSLLDLLNDFPSNPQTDYLKQLMQQMQELLDQPDVSPSQISQLSQQFYSAFSSFLATLQVDPDLLQKMIGTILAGMQEATAETTEGPRGPTGPVGATGHNGPVIGPKPFDPKETGTYQAGDMVTYEGQLYTVNTGEPIGVPGQSRDYTVLVSAGPTGARGEEGPMGVSGPAGATGTMAGTKVFDPNETDTYQDGDLITYRGSLYLVNTANPEGIPGDSPNYTVLAAAGPTGPTGLRGERGPTGITGTMTSVKPFDPKETGTYQAGEQVTYEGSLYTITKANPKGIPGDSPDYAVFLTKGPMGPTGARGPVGGTGPMESAKPFHPQEASTYQKGDMITYQGAVYTVTKANPGGIPGDSPDYASLVAAGATGPSGAKGPTGATGTMAGAKSFNPSETATYQAGDLVTYEGSLYLVNTANPEGIPGDSPNYTVLVTSGSTGPTGERGSLGPTGTMGSTKPFHPSETATYQAGQQVTYEGSVYTVTKANPEGIPGDSPDYALFLAKGSTGPTGNNGEGGATGATGIVAPTIPVEGTEEQQLQQVVEQMNTALDAFYNDPTPANRTAVTEQLTALFQVLSALPNTAHNQYLQQFLTAISSKIQNGANPKQTSLFMRQLFMGLGVLYASLLLNPISLTTLLQSTITGSVSAAGVPSEMGPIGPTGVTGEAGIVGIMGAMGETGLTGITGATGEVGPTGETGTMGIVGPTGEQGPTGAMGPIGPTGATGPMRWGRIYATNFNNNNVSVIEGESNTVIGTVAVGTYPYGVAVNERTNRIYVANGNINNSNVSIIEGESNTVVGTIIVGNGPHGVAVNEKTNRIYVANSGSSSNNVSVIDGESNTVIGTVAVGISPRGVAVNEETNRIYVSNYNSSNVSVIDGGTNTVIGTVAMGISPQGVAVNEETNRIYVSNYNSSNVSVIDGGTNTVIGTVAMGSSPRGVAVNEETNRIYVSNLNSNNVSVIDGETNTVIGTVAVGNSPYGVAVNEKTNQIYVANNGSSSNNVSVIDGESNTVIGTVAVGSSPYEVAVNPTI